MRKIKYIFSAVIITLLCYATASAYEATSYDDYASYMADMVFGAQSEVATMSLDDSDPFSCKRLMVRFDDSAYLPDGINPSNYVVFGDRGFYSFTTAKATERAYNLFNSLPDVDYVIIDQVITLDVIDESVDALSDNENTQPDLETANWGYKGANVAGYKQFVESKDAQEIVVGVIDTGLSLSHPYFASSNRVVTGYNYAEPGSDVCDYNGHGTHVAGILASSTTDNIKIKPYQIFDKNGYSSTAIFDETIIKAISDGVSVISISLSVVCKAEYCHPSLDEAYSLGIPVVVAAGNGVKNESGINIGVPASDTCPAHHMDKVITVGATTSKKSVALYSNYGPEVDICAPGSSIYSTYYDPATDKNDYKTQSGTSMATPCVSGFVAMIKSVYPDLSIEKILLLMSECADKPEGWDSEKNGAGILNMGLCASLVEGVYPLKAQFAISEETEETDGSEKTIAYEFDVQIENKSGDLIRFISYITFYNDNDVQVGSQIDGFSLKDGRKTSYTIPIEQIPSGAAYMRGYVWTDHMEPMCMTREFYIVGE